MMGGPVYYPVFWGRRPARPGLTGPVRLRRVKALRRQLRRRVQVRGLRQSRRLWRRRTLLRRQPGEASAARAASAADAAEIHPRQSIKIAPQGSRYPGTPEVLKGMKMKEERESKGKCEIYPVMLPKKPSRCLNYPGRRCPGRRSSHTGRRRNPADPGSGWRNRPRCRWSGAAGRRSGSG